MRKILEELKEKGIELVQTRNLYIGYAREECGISVTRNPAKCEKGIYFLESKGRTLPCRSQLLFATSGTEYEGRAMSRAEAEKLARQGEIAAYDCRDIYAAWYRFDEYPDLECAFKHGCSAKSWEYIRSVMDDIGMVGYTEGADGEPDGRPLEFDRVTQEISIPGSYVTVGLSGGEWYAQIYEQAAIDEALVVKIHFHHCPSEEELQQAFAVRQFLSRSNPAEIFTCYDCGRRVHWLDLPGDIRKKIDLLDEHYCGY